MLGFNYAHSSCNFTASPVHKLHIHEAFEASAAPADVSELLPHC